MLERGEGDEAAVSLLVGGVRRLVRGRLRVRVRVRVKARKVAAGLQPECIGSASGCSRGASGCRACEMTSAPTERSCAARKLSNGWPRPSWLG